MTGVFLITLHPTFINYLHSHGFVRARPGSSGVVRARPGSSGLVRGRVLLDSQILQRIEKVLNTCNDLSKENNKPPWREILAMTLVRKIINRKQSY